MNEADTRAELIDPKLKSCGWGVAEGSKIFREYGISPGKIQIGSRGKSKKADYVLMYKGIKLAVVEAKSDELPVGEGVMQAKNYAQQLHLETAYTRKTLLEKLDEAGFPKSDLLTLQTLVDMEKSDLYDVLGYVFNGDYIAVTREARAKAAEATTIFALLNDRQKEFISFVLSKYVEAGVDELDQDKLPFLLKNKYLSYADANAFLGDSENIRQLFIEFQKSLYL